MTPTLSEDNWQEEIKEGKRRAEFIKKVSPKIYETRMREEARYRKWEKYSNKTEKVVDGLGHYIDENIKETVTALNVYEINTSGSCEGHIDWGTGVPWVEITAPNELGERFIGEKNILERVALENNISIGDLKQEEKYEELYRKAENEFIKNGETKEAITWQEENKKLRMIMEDVISDFYKNRIVSDDLRLKFRNIGGFGSFRILIGTSEDYDRDYEKMTVKEKELLGQRIKKYRKEMHSFADFLQKKFFKEGESYINERRKKAQEKLDQEKIAKIKDKIGN